MQNETNYVKSTWNILFVMDNSTNKACLQAFRLFFDQSTRLFSRTID